IQYKDGGKEVGVEGEGRGGRGWGWGMREWGDSEEGGRREGRRKNGNGGEAKEGKEKERKRGMGPSGRQTAVGLELLAEGGYGRLMGGYWPIKPSRSTLPIRPSLCRGRPLIYGGSFVFYGSLL
ncbi:hypothetical protein Hamer_G027291, partial [Homarus americanus]